jgi:hypothetical protein
MKKKKSKAGAKKKPIEQVRQRVVIFIEQGRIDARGGMEAMKKHLYDVA